MNSLINEISKNLPRPSDFGVGNSEYCGWENEIERLKNIPEQYNYTINFIGGLAIVGGIFFNDLSSISVFLLLFGFIATFGGLIAMLGGRKYTDQYQKVHNEVKELESKKYNLDFKYRTAKNEYIVKELGQYKDTYLYRKRSSGHGFAENLQTYSDAVEHFSDGSRYFLSDHRDYVRSRDVLVTPYKRPPQQSIIRSHETENKVPVLPRETTQEVEQVSIKTDELELRLEDTTSLPRQEVEQQFNNSNSQSASRATNQEKANMLIGDTGEEAVANYERTMLQKNNREYLVDRVEIVSKTIGDGLGYDVLSFDMYGNEKFIEVKTTRSNDSVTNFSFTRSELNFLTKNPDTAFIYCVFGITGDNPRLKIYPATEFLDKSFEIVEYRASMP